jgi:glycosyltransferase involved in cell wall biosynthesis
MEAYKISVIIPVYNVENYIERCVVSFFEQTIKDGVEFIFVNDCTPDHSMQIIEEVASRYPNRQNHIRYINHLSNSGFSKARISGLEVAQGEYIFHGDGDDWAEKDMLADMYKVAKENDADIVRSNVFYTFPNYEKRAKQIAEVDPVGCIKLLLTEKIHAAFWNKLIRRNLYTDHKIVILDNYWEDMISSVQLFYYAKKIAYIPKAYYHYVQFNPNSSSVYYERIMNGIMKNTEGIIEFLQDNHIQIDKHIHYLKLAAKKNLLFTCDKSSFRKWLQIYPESNKYIWSYPSLPFHLRMIGGCTTLKLWPLVDLWIWIKKRKQSLA